MTQNKRNPELVLKHGNIPLYFAYNALCSEHAIYDEIQRDLIPQEWPAWNGEYL